MANNTETQKPKERVKYKFGQSDIDLTNYIHNLGTNVQSYLNSKNWNDGQKQEFMNAYNRYLTGLQDQLANNTNRFTTDDFGSIIDSTGALSNTDNDDIDPVGSEYYYDDKGNRITTDDFNALKKRKQKNYNTFSANREVATYFNAIGNALRSKQPTKEQTSNAFDLSKHGFLADWTRINNPAGGNLNLDPYLEKDAVDEATGKRGTTNRAAYLKEQIENYINNIGDYDFSSTPFKDRDTYVSRLRAAAENLGNGYNSEDVIALNQAGIGNEFLSKFFSTGTEEPQAKQSELERQAEQSAQELAQRRRDDELRAVIEEEKQDQYNRQRDAFFADYQKQNPFNSTIKSQAIALSYNPNAMYDRAATKYGVDRSNTEALQSAVKEYINFPQLAAAIRGKEHILQGQKDVTAAHIANNLDWAAQSNLLTDKIGDTGYYIVPGSENYDNWSYIAYNPITRHYEEQSMLLNEELKKKMAYAEYDRRNKDVQKHQLGGLLKYTEEYQKKAQKEAEKQQRIDQKVEETGKTREQVEAAERRPMEEGFSTIDKVRLGTAAADAISAAAAFIPGYGTVASGVLGIGSTLTNIGADIADESMSGWDVAGNALYGLGMDVVGLIPGMGATGKAAKIVRVLKPVSKLAMRTLQAYGMVHSADAFNKLMSNPSDMSADDWRNLVTGLQAISGEARYKGGKRAVSRATTQRDVADVKTSTGRMATISKEDLDKLRETKGLKAQNKLFSELTGGQKLQREFKGREFNWKQPWKSRLHSDNPEFSTRTESTFLPEDTSWDARLFRGMQKKEGNSKKKPSQQTTASNFDRLRNLSSQTGKLTPQEIATINRQRVKSGKGKLTQQEIEALNQRRSNRAGSAEDNSFQARLARYKQDKKDGKFNSVEDDIKRAKDELAEATRQQRLAVPTGQGSIVSPDAKEARFIMGLSKAIPTVNPSRPPITNPPAIIPRQQIEIPKPQTTPFNSQRIREGLERDIGDTRIQRAIESNPERTARLQAQEAYRNVRQYFNMYGVPQYKKPLTGAARRNKQNTYNQLFGEGYYAMQDALRNRPLPHKQSNKKKKTSRDDRRTVKREEGGILDKVRKFDGGGITETARKATQYALNNNWFTNLYNQKSLTGWDSSKDASKAGVSITNQNASHGNAGDLSIPFYKNLMYTSQSNLVGQDLQSYYNSAFQGKSLEDYVNGYNANAAKIRGYWDQERAYRQAGASEHNRLFRNMFGNRSNNSNDVWNIGYDPKLDDVVGSSTWLRRMDRYEKEFDALSDEEKKARVHKIDLGGGNVGYVYKKANGDIAIWNEPVAPEQPTEPTKPASTTTVIGPEQPKKEGDTREMFSFLRNINPTIAYGLPRAVYADRMNRRMTDLAKASVTPLLKDPFQVHRYTRSDLDAEMQGERNYANLRRLASRPITSDGSLQTATQLQAEVQGQEARTAGKEKSNQTQRQYDELAWQQEKENAANRHETAMFNRAQQWGADQDKSKFEQAYLSKKFNIWDTFGQQLEYDARTKQQENKALADNFARSDIHNAVNYAPNDYGANLTPEELTVWNKVLSGTNPSSLSTQEFNSYRLAAQKVSRVETDQLRQHYNIPNTRWSGKAGVPNTPWSASISFVKKGGIISAKNGSKIAVAGIEAKTADAERFQKQIKDCIDRNEKTLDRLSKSLYGLIKASMIK